MSQFANYAQSVVRANNEVYILFLTVFSIGIAIGSMVCDTLLKGEITARFTPVTGFGISLFTYLMVVTTPIAKHEGLIDVRIVPVRHAELAASHLHAVGSRLRRAFTLSRSMQLLQSRADVKIPARGSWPPVT